MKRLMYFRWTLAVLVAAAVSFAFTIAKAQQQPQTPSQRGSDPDQNPVEVPNDGDDDPNDGDGAFGRTTSETEKEEPGYWHNVYIHNNSKQGTAATWMTISTKYNPDGDDLKKDDKRHRICIKRIKRRSGTTWDDWQDVDKCGEEVKIELDNPVAHCEVLRVQFAIEVDKTKRKNPASGPYEWENDWKVVEGDSATFNVSFQDAVGNDLVSNGAGSDPAGSGNPEAGDPGSMAYMFADISPEMNLQPTSIGADAGTFDAPDLILSERGLWSIPEGNLRIHATGEASFSSQSSLQVLARDVQGNDAVAGSAVVIGTPTVSNGVIQVPIVSRESNAEHRIAIMIRGAKVDVPATASGTVIRYAFGGVPAGPRPVRMPAMLVSGAEPDSYVFRTSAEVEVVHIHPSDPENPGVMTRRVGSYTWMARPYDTSANVGYIDAIVLGEPEAGHIRSGSFEVTPVDPFEFVETEDTKMFVVNADNYAGIDGAFESASIEVTASGALKVTLGARNVLDQPILIVILSPKLDLGQGPFTVKQGARVAIGGDALRGGLGRTVRLVEFDYGTEADHALLPTGGHTATALTPLAEVEPE